jgi:TM2 domain-containing membrane protein YozV
VTAPSPHFAVPKKSVGVTYVLWFFFGGLGAHKFYLGRPGVAGLYICMFFLFWAGLLGLSAAVTDHVLDAMTVAFDQADHPFPVVPRQRFGVSVTTGLGMIAPLLLACVFDLVTIPSQVHAANARLVANSQGASGAASGAGARTGDGEAEFSPEKADELIARYIAQQSRSTVPATEARSTSVGAPTFGKRRR